MKIKGLQKTTLIDYPGKISCTIFLYGCNMRCGFCHNPELVLREITDDIDEEKILEFLERRKKYLDGVCITGGEPLMSLDKEFVKKIKELGYFVKIDTNGCFPDKLKELIDEGLVDYVAVDIKAGPDKYFEVTNSKVDLKAIEKTIKMVSGLSDYEFRTTILLKYHDRQEIEKMMKWLKNICGKKMKKFVLQGFKNHGKFVDGRFVKEEETEEEILKKLKKIAEDYFEEVEMRV